MASQTVSTVRLAALRSQCLSFAKSFSMGLRSGEYFGSKNSLAPAERMARPHGLALVRTEIVHDDDIAGLVGGDENLIDIELETLAIDRFVDKPWCIDAIMTQRRQKRHGLPMAVRHLGFDPLTARRPSSEWSHVGLGPGLVDEHQAGRIDTILIFSPLCPPACHIRAILLRCDQRLFL
jgi:hypothetical protein